MAVVKRLFFIVSGIFFALLLSVVLFVVSRPHKADPIIRLEEYATLSATADSDGDGVPNWLEEIQGSDSFSASSFPYNRDIVRARHTVSDALLYGGPGDFTEEVIQRFLFDLDGSAAVTEEERQRFVAESSEYFLQAVEERGELDIVLKIDDSVSRQEILEKFVTALQLFPKEQPVDVVVFNIFAQDTPSIEIARRMRTSCEQILQILPHTVPSDVYDLYYFILKRVTHLCKALDVALTSTTPHDFFYTLYLVLTTMQHDDMILPNQDDGIPEGGEFEMAINEVIRLLQT